MREKEPQEVMADSYKSVAIELSKAQKQRDELRDALDDLINRPFKAGTRPGDAQRDRARAALRGCE